MVTKRISKELAREFNVGVLKDSKVKFFNDAGDKIKNAFNIMKQRHKSFPIKNGIAFPIIDPFNGLQSFTVRNMDFKRGESYPPKYFIFSGFKKNFYLGGLNRALEHILKENSVFIFEGYFDMLAAREKGIKNGVFLCGKTLSRMQLALLRSLTENIILALDNDEAGLKGLEKMSKFITQETGDLCKMVFLDYNLDPEEFLRQSKDTSFKGRIF